MLRSAVLALILAVPAAAQTPLPQGDWIGGVLTSSFVLPRLESLEIHGQTARHRAWGFDDLHDTACTGAPGQPVLCQLPVEMGALSLVPAAGGLRFEALGPQTAPFDAPVFVDRWASHALAGPDWQVLRNDRVLFLLREGVVEDVTVAVPRAYVPASAGTGEALFHYLRIGELPVGWALCGMMALQAVPEDWAAFLDFVQLVAPVTAEIERIALRADRSEAELLRAMTLRMGPERLGARAVDVSDLPEAARAAWVPHFDTLRRGTAGHAPPGWITWLGWPAAPEVVAAADGCVRWLRGL